jgi:hypothetical protein
MITSNNNVLAKAERKKTFDSVSRWILYLVFFFLFLVGLDDHQWTFENRFAYFLVLGLVAALSDLFFSARYIALPVCVMAPFVAGGTETLLLLWSSSQHKSIVNWSIFWERIALLSIGGLGIPSIAYAILGHLFKLFPKKDPNRIEKFLVEGTPAAHLSFPLTEAREKNLLDLKTNPERIEFMFGGRRLLEPEGVAYPMRKNTIIIGESGSGKSLIINTLLAQAGKTMRLGSRGIFYDAQGIAVSLCQSINEHGNTFRYKAVDPFREVPCGVQWDIQGEINGDFSMCDTIAQAFVPDPKDPKANFFDSGVRNYVKELLHGFVQEVETFSFPDVVQAILYHEVGDQIIAKTAEGRSFLRKYRSDPNADVTRNMDVFFQPYAALAASWERQPNLEKISLREWAKDNYLLIFRRDNRAETACDIITSTMLNLSMRYTREKQNVPLESMRDLTWYFLDELPNLPPIERLENFMNVGRQKGACIVLGIQNVDLLRTAYKTEGQATAILDSANNLAILRGAKSTAEWAEKRFGTVVWKYITHGKSESSGSGPHGGSSSQGTSTTETIQREPALSASNITTVFRSTPEEGLSGYFYSASFSKDHAPLWQTNISPKEVDIVKETPSSTARQPPEIRIGVLRLPGRDKCAKWKISHPDDEHESGGEVSVKLEERSNHPEKPKKRASYRPYAYEKKIGEE